MAKVKIVDDKEPEHVNALHFEAKDPNNAKPVQPPMKIPAWSFAPEELMEQEWVIRIYGHPFPIKQMLNFFILISLVGLCYNLGVWTQIEQQKVIAYECGIKQPNGIFWACTMHLNAARQVEFICGNQTGDPRDNAALNRLLNFTTETNP